MKPLERVPVAELDAFTRRLREAVLFDEAVAAVLPTQAEPSSGGSEPSSHRSAPSTVAAAVPDEIALVVETSGSTDAPKRVMLSGAALRASAGATEQWFGGQYGQWLLALPVTYIAGIQVLVRSILAGTEPAVLPPGGFTPGAFVEAARGLDPDHPWFTSLVPVQLARLVEAAEHDRAVGTALGSFDRILLGGQAAPPGLVERARELGATVHRTYGSSETAGGCVYDGRALPGVGVRIGADGTVELSGRMLATGYLGDPDRTASAFGEDADGTRWYRTGDLGELTADGTLRIGGRADDVIISGGVKVALGEIERAVRRADAPGLASAVVVAVADPEWGERAAVVVEGASVALDVLAAATDAAGLPPAARPVRVLAVDAMPLLASGKPDRRALAALVVDGH
ncbi:AMP-binding protein [Agromyces sp. LHK192]|uniref:AMP-binding protein n=1 Tax=Agromyces sp. LHK192 TaxID=2498704 RepID=UPI001F0C1F72|nr:AMP-binding protein [Agromyces sp. LHK192]